MVRAMLMITLHLFLFSFVMGIVVFKFGCDVRIYSEDGTAVDENLCENVEDAVVDFTRRWHHQGDEREDDAEGE